MEEQVKPLRGYSEEPKFYVYLHKRPDGTVFYVGKGHGRRAWAKKDRNNHWRNVVNKHGGFSVEIVAQGLTEQEAFAKERELVLSIGFENLTNQTLGGISTTGFRHSDETKELQSQITKDRIKSNPEYLDIITSNLTKLHYKQRNDPEYKKQLSEKIKEGFAKLPEEVRQEHIRKKTAWLNDQAKRDAVFKKLKELNCTPESRALKSRIAKEIWESLDEDEKQRRRDKSTAVLNDPEVRAKTVELNSDKVVVNRLFVFSSKRKFLDYIDSEHAPLMKAFLVGKNKYCFDFALFKGFFVEEYNQDLHFDIPQWSGGDIPKLGFDCFPRSKGIVRSDGAVYLSMLEAAKDMPCRGSDEAKADFITKNMKINKTSYGFMWRIATNEELQKEILRRLNMLIDDYKNK